MNITPVVRKFLTHRMRSIERYTDHAEDIQRGVLRRLVNAAEHTAYGKAFQFDKIRLYENFAQRVPLNDYDSLKPYIERMRHGEPDVLWKGHVHWFAKSSGTTHDKSKFIPVSPRGLKHIHYKGGTDSVAIYLHRHNPESRLFEGKALILGGSHQPDANLPQSLAGDLSAILLENTSSFVNHFRVPSKPTALLSDFEQKRLKIAEETVGQNVTNLSGVPSWMMGVIRTVLEKTGATTLDEVWPNLEVFFHGGVAFTPYREQYRRIIPSQRMHYVETYNASEGFFGIQDLPDNPGLLLMLDYDVFYEFIPVEEVGKAQPRIIPLWEVEPHRNYAMVITTSCGLWRYQIGDTVRFDSVRPYRFRISGRTKCFINAFGEELMVDNAEQGLDKACRLTGAEVEEYTAAPVFMDSEGHCRHQWVVEFRKQPASVEAFADALDAALKELNSDYEAKRYKDLTLQRPEIVVARQGLFNDWLKSRGKLGGQHKVPRLANDRNIIEQVLLLNK
ncbi:MAG: GH3 auxin-responsive promoter family protein [Alloprevotella sp.]